MNASVEAVTIVMPLKIDANIHGNDLFRVTRVLLPSLLRFFKLDQLKEVIVISPVQECAQVEDALKPFQRRIRCRVIPEEMLLRMIPGWGKHRRYIGLSDFLRKRPASFFARTLLKRIGNRKTWLQLSGWYRQQVLKLCAARLVSTRYYMTCDADVCLTRYADCSLLFPDGRAIYSREPASKHPDWWRSSAEVLNISPRFNPDDSVMSVTPELLVTDLVLKLLRHLQRQGRTQGYATIFDYLIDRQGWTEHQMYWLFVTHFCGAERYYSEKALDYRLIDIENSIWHASDVSGAQGLSQRLSRAFDGGAGLFLVVQTNSIPAQDYASAVEPWLRRKDHHENTDSEPL